MRRTRSLSAPVLVSVMLIATLAVVATAGPTRPRHHAVAPARAAVAAPAPDHRSAAPAPAPGAAPHAGAGMVVTLEPEGGGPTGAGGRLVPRLSPLERVGLLRTTAGLTAVRLPDGTMMLDLRGRYRQYSVVRIDPAGVARLGCAHDLRGIERALDPCTPAAPRFEER